MKKLHTLLLILFGNIFYLSAQNSHPAHSQVDGENFACSYFGFNNIKRPQDICNYLKFTSNNHAEQVVDKILKQVGLSRNFIVMECPNTQNCFATVVEGQRYIIYDGSFMKRIEDLTNTDWSAISIVAHEIGHHLQGHTIDGKGSRPQKELEADKFSGFVMYKLGANLEDALVAINALADDTPTFSHPGKSQRIEAIKKGWFEAEALQPRNGSKTKATPTPEPKTTTPTEEEEVDEEKNENIGCIAGNCDNGVGIYVAESEERYQGDFRFGKRHGQGIHYYPDGSVRYKGDFREDKRIGYGAYYFTNGDKYVGLFANNLPNGKGTYYYASGERFVGQYKDGKRHGDGAYYYKNGKREAGFYQNDEQVR
jgi:hypothetical protein